LNRNNKEEKINISKQNLNHNSRKLKEYAEINRSKELSNSLFDMAKFLTYSVGCKWYFAPPWCPPDE
jgi:hypothetical protein